MPWMNLRYAGKCHLCSRSIPQGERAYYDRATKKVTCNLEACCTADKIIGLDPDPTAVLDTAPFGAKPGYKAKSVDYKATATGDDYALTAEAARIVRELAAMMALDGTLPTMTALITDARVLVSKIDGGTKLAPTVRSGSKQHDVGGFPPEIILECGTCGHLSDSHECKEKS